MPSLGADMEHGKVVEWLVKPGEYVHRGDLVAEVDTEKTVMEIESFEEGVVAEYLVELGETVPVGTPIARVTGTPADLPVGVDAPGDALAAAAAEAEPAVEAGRVAEGAPAPDARFPAEAGSAATRAIPDADVPVGHPPVAPPIRHLAHQLGVEVDDLHGSGRHGAVTRADVEAAAQRLRGASGPTPATIATALPTPGIGAPRVRSSPRARRLAGELGVDLAEVEGTGPGGAVTEADLRRDAAARPAPADGAEPAARAKDDSTRAERGGPRRRPPESDGASETRAASVTSSAGERVAGLRRAIGALMSRSKREIPHYYLSTSIDLGAALDWMREANAGRPIAERLVPAALLLAASARAARDVPEMNGFFVDGEFRRSEAVHLGVAVALRGGGLVAPAIHDADRLAPNEVMAALRDLVGRARAGRLRRDEMADPTITVTNLGELGVESVFGVIYAPQVALVGFGRVVERPWAQNGLLGVRPIVTATLSADHRVSDGLRGGRFLARVDELLQKPEEL